MNKLDFFLAAMHADEFKRRSWVIAAFSLIKEDPNAWKADPYPYRIVQSPSGHYYVDPNNANQLTQIAGAKAGEPIYHVKEHVLLKAGQLPNLKAAVDTTYGRILFNYTAIIYPLNSKIDYINRRITATEVEEMILPRFKDTPAPGELRKQEDIYVDEYLKFCDAIFFLAGFTQLCVPAGTRKTMTASPDIPALKARLLKENAGRLHDPAVIAKIDAELVKHDEEVWMKGDAGEGFLITKKSYQIVRKKLFGMHGAEVGLEEGTDVELIENSLSQGWDINKFPAMNNSLRAGSFNRGAQTMLGGESVKWLLRASSNITVTTDDCGSKLGNVIAVDGNNYQHLTGFHVITKDGSKLVPDDAASKTYVGQRVMLRSPMFCKLDKTDYCKACVGMRLSENPTGLSAAISEYGSAFLGIFMAAAHGKALVLAKMNYKDAII